MESRFVTTEGIVVGDYEGPTPALGGFYLQDAEGDGDPATSDAVFVFNGGADAVALGDRVRIRGTAGESQGQTRIADVESVVFCASGQAVEPVDVALPLPHPDELERVEGMLVRFPQTLYVTEHYQLGRFGAVVLSGGGRLPQPTSVAPPGALALAVQEHNERNRIIVDDATDAQNPETIPFARGGDPLRADNTLRGGDRVTGVVGIMTWTWGGNRASPADWRLRPLGALGGGMPFFEAADPRSGAPSVGGSLRVGSFNVLNYFNTFSGCRGGARGEPTDCRGADGPEAFERQWRKTVATIAGMDADVLGLVEMENDGYGPDSAIRHLVDRLNEASAPGTWALLDVDAATGRPDALGSDAIKVGLLYRPARVAPVGRTAVLSSRAFVTGGDPGPRTRPSLAQAFETPAGARFVANVNHFKSKGSPCRAPDAGDGQGNCNGVRTAAARELAEWLATDPTGADDPDVLVLGDLNAYAREDPVRALADAGYVDLIAAHEGPMAYSYVFGGQWGYLDHALASPSLTRQVTGASTWHVNADEPPVLGYEPAFKSTAQQEALYAPDPFRSSDHDPVVVGLELVR